MVRVLLNPLSDVAGTHLRSQHPKMLIFLEGFEHSVMIIISTLLQWFMFYKNKTVYYTIFSTKNVICPVRVW